MYSKFSITTIRAPPFRTQAYLPFWTFLSISQPKMVRFSFYKKRLQAGKALSLMGVPPKCSLHAGRPYRGICGKLMYFHIKESNLPAGWRICYKNIYKKGQYSQSINLRFTFFIAVETAASMNSCLVTHFRG